MEDEKVFCLTCGICLGKYRPNFAKTHIKIFPSHDSFLVKTLVDPLILNNSDKWFATKLANRQRNSVIKNL